jgi:hypothetical protein
MVDSHPCRAPGEPTSKTLARLVDLLRRFKNLPIAKNEKAGPQGAGSFHYW